MEKIYNNLFECEYPVVQGELIWKKHPDYNIEVSNYGHFRNIDDEDNHMNKTGRVVHVLTYEAFNGVKLKKNTYIIPKNMNPYDTRIENLIISTPFNNERLKQERQFIKNTLDEMLRKEPKIPGGMDPEEYWIQLGIPRRYMTYWRKLKQTGKIKI